MNFYVRSRLFCCCVRFFTSPRVLLDSRFCTAARSTRRARYVPGPLPGRTRRGRRELHRDRAVLSVRHESLQTSAADAPTTVTKKVTQTREQEIIIWVIAVFASAMALVSAFGFAGCVAKNLKFVVAYHVMIWSLFAVNVAASIVALFRAFHGDRTQVRSHVECMCGVEADETKQFDERPLTSAGRAEMATGVFINWAIHLCAPPLVCTCHTTDADVYLHRWLPYHRIVRAPAEGGASGVWKHDTMGDGERAGRHLADRRLGGGYCAPDGQDMILLFQALFLVRNDAFFVDRARVAVP
jgi:hypothetical protein